MMAHCAEVSKFSAFPIGNFRWRATHVATAVYLHQKGRPYVAFGCRMSQNLEKSHKEAGSKASLLLLASEKYIEESITAIKAGKIIAVPTDTIYGFACDACSAAAVNRIYEVKGRKSTAPLAICVADVPDIPRFASIDGLPPTLLDTLLPGPVTIILKKGNSSILDKSINPGFDSVGVRIPDYGFIRSIARGSGSALALTSANRSGQPSSVCPSEFGHLWRHCEYVFDGGVLQRGRAGSTLVDLTEPGLYKVLRPGSGVEETVAVLRRFGLKEAM